MDQAMDGVSGLSHCGSGSQGRRAGELWRIWTNATDNQQSRKENGITSIAPVELKKRVKYGRLAA